MMVDNAMKGYMSQLPYDVSMIGEDDLCWLGKVNLLIARWPCQGCSCARSGKGLQDWHSKLFWKLFRILQWWQTQQPIPICNLLENVLTIGDMRLQVQGDALLVQQKLGTPMTIDDATFGLYAHHFLWIWTNLAPPQVVRESLQHVVIPQGRQVDHIYLRRHEQVVMQQDPFPLTPMNKVGTISGFPNLG